MSKKTTATKADIDENRGIASISYIFILCFIPLLVSKDSKFAQFHAKQGLVLFVIEIIMQIIFNPIVLFILPFLAVIYVPMVIGVVVLSVVGIVRALNGQEYKMPIIYNIVKALNL